MLPTHYLYFNSHFETVFQLLFKNICEVQHLLGMNYTCYVSNKPLFSQTEKNPYVDEINHQLILVDLLKAVI